MIRTFTNYTYVESSPWWYIDVNSHSHSKYECFKAIFPAVDSFGKFEDDSCYVGHSFIKNGLPKTSSKLQYVAYP